MGSVFAAPFAELFEFNFLGNQFLILAGPVIDAFAGGAAKLYKSIL